MTAATKRWWKAHLWPYKRKRTYGLGIEVHGINDGRDLPGTFSVTFVIWRYEWTFGREVRASENGSDAPGRYGMEAMTKIEFKDRWDSGDDGGGITNDDCADCAKAWGLYSTPRIHPIAEVVKAVCEAAGVET